MSRTRCAPFRTYVTGPVSKVTKLSANSSKVLQDQLPYHNQESRVAVRALLRECTYLPDSHARRWWRDYVLDRARRYSAKTWSGDDMSFRDDTAQLALRNARMAINLLQRANEGERKPLLKVLLMAYGRTGRRRREIMSTLTRVPRAEQSTELAESFKQANLEQESLEDESFEQESLELRNFDLENCEQETAVGAAESPKYQYHGDFAPRPPNATEVNQGRWDAYVPAFSPQLRALLASQLQHRPPNLTRPLLRRMTPHIEELNSWQRPMPLKRVKNKVQQWYADTLDKVHPPLPKLEWLRLQSLATGRSTEPSVRRRAPKPASPSALELIVQSGKPNKRKAFGNPYGHSITPRYMQRLWATVFTQCPLMEWDAASGTWNVMWGRQGMARTEPEHGKPRGWQSMGDRG